MAKVSAEPLVRALVDALDDEALDVLAAKLAPRIELRIPRAEPDGWLDTRGAALYLAMTATALQKLTAARSVPFHQDVPRGKCWFLRSELDAWRRATRTPSSRRT